LVPCQTFAAAAIPLGHQQFISPPRFVVEFDSPYAVDGIAIDIAVMLLCYFVISIVYF